MADDALSAALEEIRGLLAASDALIGRMRAGATVSTIEFNAAQDRLAERVAPLLAALDAVLEHHQPRQLYQLVTGAPAAPVCDHGADYDGDDHIEDRFGYVYCKDKPTVKVCTSCADGPDGDEWAAWPCPTYQAITRELTGEATDV